VKQAMFAYVNHVLSNEGKVSCSRKQRGPLLGLELTTDRHRYALRHAAPRTW